MSMKAIFVVGSALVMSATLNAQTQKPQPAQRAPSVKPAQSQQGARGAEPESKLKKLDLSAWLSTPIEGRVVKGAPYSAVIETESVQTLGDGNRIVHRSTSRVYRDTEGRVRREEDRAAGSSSITISDPVAKKSITLDSANRTAHEAPGFGFFHFALDGLLLQTYQYGWALRSFQTIAGADFARFSRSATATSSSSGTQGDYTIAVGRGGRGGAVRGRDEYVEEPLPNRTIEGVIASGIRRTTTIPQGAIGNEQPIKTVSEEWTSVDLQVLVLTEVNDPRNGRSTYRLVNIIRAEPDPALFKVPADYKIRLDLRPKTSK